MLMHLRIVSGYFHSTTVEFRSCTRDHMAWKVEVFPIMPIPALGHLAVWKITGTDSLGIACRLSLLISLSSCLCVSALCRVIYKGRNNTSPRRTNEMTLLWHFSQGVTLCLGGIRKNLRVVAELVRWTYRSFCFSCSTRTFSARRREWMISFSL